MRTQNIYKFASSLIIELNLIENNFRIYCHLKIYIESTVAY